jgi:hypothetical protein
MHVQQQKTSNAVDEGGCCMAEQVPCGGGLMQAGVYSLLVT